MIIIALVIAVCTLIFASINFKNKYIYILASYLLCICFMIFTAVLYVSKISSYKFPMKIDRMLMIAISDIKIHIYKLSELYNILFAVFMFISVMAVKSVRQISLKAIVFLCVPIVLFVVFTDYRFLGFMYVINYTNQYSFDIIPVINSVLWWMFIAYCLFPVAVMLKNMLETQIFSRRNFFAAISFCIFIINVYMFSLFIAGPFKNIYFSNVGYYKLPVNRTAINGYVFMPIIFLCVLSVVVILMTRFKPIGVQSINIFQKLRVSVMFRNNLYAIMHTYKNSMLAIGYRLNLAASSYHRKPEHDEHIKKALYIVNDQLKMLTDTVGLLKNQHKKARKISIIDCIERAILDVNDKDVIYIRNYMAEVFEVYGDSNSFIESFKNIFLNSVDAMSGNSGEKRIIIDVISEQNVLMVKITDNGKGISSKRELKKMFELFYTTKEQNKGMGIGLSSVKNSVKMYEGEVRAVSEPGSYMSIEIALPVAKGGKRI